MGQNQSSKRPVQSNYAPKPKSHSPSSSAPSSSSSSSFPPSSSSTHKKSSPRSSHKPKTHNSHGMHSRHEDRESDWERRYGYDYNYESGRGGERGGGWSSSDSHHGVRTSYGHLDRSAPQRQFSLTRQTPAGSNSPPKMAQIEKYFNKYKDEGEDAILAEGMEKFCVDLGVDPTEFVVLLLAWKFEASQMCRFTREEFLNGCQKLRAHDSRSLKDRFPELLVEVRGKKIFKELYNFTFSFGLDHTTGQRSLPIDMAIPLWDLVFYQDRPAILDRWFAFLKATEVRGISRDTWNMFLPFCNTIRPDLSNYDEAEAWPSLFDDFVEYESEPS